MGPSRGSPQRLSDFFIMRNSMLVGPSCYGVWLSCVLFILGRNQSDLECRSSALGGLLD